MFIVVFFPATARGYTAREDGKEIVQDRNIDVGEKLHYGPH